MPIHDAMASRFPLLDGVPSMQELFENPDFADQRAAFEAHPDYDIPAVEVRSETVPGPHGPIPVRVYAPERAVDAACVVWMHGGAFLAGDLDMPAADWVARELVARAGVAVVSVDYRLCRNGVTYPVPHDDVAAATRWVRDHAGALGIDPRRISIGGASAGANLAAGAALKLRDVDEWMPANLVFAYGVAHAVMPPLSSELIALMAEVPPVLQFPPAVHRFFNHNFLGGPLSRADGYAFPALADLRGLCPVLVLNAEYDDLRTSGEAFAAALVLAGVDVRQVQLKGMLHGFLNLPATVEPVAAALDLIAATVTERERTAV